MKLFSQFGTKLWAEVHSRTNMTGPVKVVLMKKDEDDKNTQDYCFIRFQYVESVQRVLAHPYNFVLNNLVL